MAPATSKLTAGPVDKRTSRAAENATFVWAISGVTLLLVQAQLRLGSIAWEALSSTALTPLQIGTCGGWIVSNAYLEGYRGFHRRFVPRVVARAHHLAKNPGFFPPVLGPVFAMAYVHATKRAQYAAWGITAAVLIAIFLVRQLDQPWRGIIDAGVVVGLFLGTVSLLLAALQRMLGREPAGNPDLPHQGD